MNTTMVPTILPLKSSGNMSSYTSTAPGSSPLVQQHICLTVLLCLVFILGFFLNSFSLWVFCCRMSRWSSGTVLQFHLALSDTIALPVSPIVAVYFSIGSNRLLCYFQIALFASHVHSSIIFLTLISIHRYVAVVHFNEDSRMKQKGFVKKLCASVWALVLILSVVCASLLPSSKEGGHEHCLSIHQNRLIDTYFVINIFLWIVFLLPFTVSAVFYCRLASTVARLNIDTAKGLAVKVKSQKMIGVCLVIFGLSFLPCNVVRTVAVVLKKYYPEQDEILPRIDTAYYASWIWSELLNSCLNPLLYCFASQKFRDAFQSLRKPIRKSIRKSKRDSE